MSHTRTELSPPIEARRRLLAAEPYPPLEPPSLEGGVAAATAELDTPSSWPADEDLRREIERLETSPGSVQDRPSADSFAPGSFPESPPSNARNGYTAPGELERLRAENEEMHKLIEEMKQIFEQATSQEEANSRELARLNSVLSEHEHQAQEKDDQVQLLTLQIQELEQHIQEPAAAPPTEDELSKMSDELEKERCKMTQDRRQLDEERQQLRDDEESLMKQMREMEVQMAKERAEMARQRTELQRLHGEVRHELEQLQRGDGALKDRLAQFHRRHQEVFNRPGSNPAAPQVAAPEADADPAAKANGREAGLIGRFFGRK